MKIVIAIPCLLKGGTEMQTLNLARVLVNEGYSVTTLVYFETDEEIVSEYRLAGSNVVAMNLRRSIHPLMLIQNLRKYFVNLKPDVVHVQYMAPGALPIIAARLAGVKMVIATVHQPYTKTHGRLAWIMLRFSSMICDRFIAVSKNAEQSWFGSSQLFNENSLLSNQPRHFTIHNGVDKERISQIASNSKLVVSEPIIPKGRVVVGAVSRLRYEKGIDLLIEAFAKALPLNPEMNLLIVGSGPDGERLKMITIEKRISDHCTFFGEANWEVAMEQMARMDIVVVPSRFEGFGLTAAEAMAMGKPVIASSVFGLKEVVQNGETGLLFDSGNVDGLSTSIHRLVNETALRLRMGDKAIQYVEEHFSMGVFRQKTLALYSQLKN